MAFAQSFSALLTAAVLSSLALYADCDRYHCRRFNLPLLTCRSVTTLSDSLRALACMSLAAATSFLTLAARAILSDSFVPRAPSESASNAACCWSSSRCCRSSLSCNAFSCTSAWAAATFHACESHAGNAGRALAGSGDLSRSRCASASRPSSALFSAANGAACASSRFPLPVRAAAAAGAASRAAAFPSEGGCACSALSTSRSASARSCAPGGRLAGDLSKAIASVPDPLFEDTAASSRQAAAQAAAVAAVRRTPPGAPLAMRTSPRVVPLATSAPSVPR